MSKYHKDLNKEQIKLMEKLADIEHQRWSSWQEYFHSKCFNHRISCYNHKTKQDDAIKTGNMVIPREAWERAERQIKTDYKDLSEQEKDSDREQVLRYFHLIN